MIRVAAGAIALLLGASVPASAQSVQHRGFVESRAFWFPRDASLDRQNLIVDLLAREELFLEPAPWLRFAAGGEFRANTGDQVADSFTPDIGDRGSKRPILSIRRLSATANRGPVTIDVGKQFIRWGKTDIVTPTDRFAPRDFLNVIESEFLAVRGVRGVAELSSHTIDVAWVPVFTPSRLPLPGKRWVVLPGDVPFAYEQRRTLPSGSQSGIRWGFTGSGFEYSLSFFDGFNHLPVVEPVASAPLGVTQAGFQAPLAVAVRFPSLRMYGADAAVPTRFFTAKGEAAYFTTSTAGADEYVLFVVQLERQTGEWLLIGGYAGEIVTDRRAAETFAPDRGTARSIIGRASYTLDANRSVAVETAIRETLEGVYLRAEYSRAYGGHWRATISTAVLGGESDDFLGQYRRNSHFIVGARYSF